MLEFVTFSKGRLMSPGVALRRSVVCQGGFGWRSSKDGRAEEKLLECIEVSFEKNDIERCVLRAEGVFDLLGDKRMIEDSSEGCFGLIIPSGELASGTDFFLEFHDREKEVVVEAELSIE